MSENAAKKRIWAWMWFDWAQQPVATLGLTFIFGPYFAAIATEYFMGQGLSTGDAKVQAQSMWSNANFWAGLAIAIPAPFLGAWTDSTGRRLPYIWAFVAVAILCMSLLWGLTPEGTSLLMFLALFWVGFVASETAFNLNNAYLPGLVKDDKVGRLSGGATAFGYWGGVLSLFIMLLLFAENDSGVTLIGIEPILGLDPSAREGTRSVGPFIAIWFAIFMLPYALWMRDTRNTGAQASFASVISDLWTSVKRVARKKSYGSFLLGSMFYRDALTALYAYGGVYASLVLDWSIIQVGVFGIIAAIAAAALSWVGGIADQRIGPKPVIVFCILSLILVCSIIIGMSRQSLFGVPLAEGSIVPDIIMYVCGSIMGGAGGALYSASRTLLVRHADPARPAEAFGLFSLAGKATAFLAPLLISLFTVWTNNIQLGFLPVIALFIVGLVLLRNVDRNGAIAA